MSRYRANAHHAPKQIALIILFSIALISRGCTSSHVARRKMFSIRDSAEPEDCFSEYQDTLPPSPVLSALTPIIFDLPSTTTEPSSTSIPTQKQTLVQQTPHRAELHSSSRTTPRERSAGKRRRTNNSLSAVEDVSCSVWDFEVSPQRTTRARTMVDFEDVGKKDKDDGKGSGNSPATRKRRNSVTEVDENTRRSTRRNSMTLERVTRGQGSIAEEEEEEEVVMISSKGRKRPGRYIEVEDSDVEGEMNGIDQTVKEEEVAQDQTETQQTEIIVDDEELHESITVQSRPRRRSMNVMVEIPLKSSRTRKTPRATLEEITFQPPNHNLMATPEPSPEKPVPIASRHITSTLAEKPSPSQDLENVVLTNVPATSKSRPTSTADKDTGAQAQTMTPTKSMGVARILAKSPNRPMYRVGLSRRVNVEPLHGYLKRSGS